MLIEQILEQKRGALRANDIAEILDLSENKSTRWLRQARSRRSGLLIRSGSTPTISPPG
jgi:transposase